MSRKKRKPFLQTNQGRGIVGLVAVGIAVIFVLSLIPHSTSDDNRAEEEIEDVYDGSLQMLGVTSLQGVQADGRIEDFAGTEAEATRDMTDGGLFDIADSYVKSGSITPLNEIIGLDTTDYRYWIDAKGTLHQEAP
ncbi:MAG: hypothetical protein R6U37_09525 [Dehalococcoidia bacterium]